MKRLFRPITCFAFTFIQVAHAQDNKPMLTPRQKSNNKPSPNTIIPTNPVNNPVYTNPVNTTVQDNNITLTDIDGNIYKTVRIGNQIWMAENLKTTRYKNGISIPNVKDENEWIKLTEGAYCFYENDAANNSASGKLYNWHAVNNINGLAPNGWHIPSDEEWTILLNYLGGDDAAGNKMKYTNGWEDNGNGTNSSEFTGLPAGTRYDGGLFYYKGFKTYFWSATEDDTDYAWIRGLYNNYSDAHRSSSNKNYGFSVRCIRD